MLDLRLIRSRPDVVKQALRDRLPTGDAPEAGKRVDAILELDAERRAVQRRLEEKRRALNEAAAAVAATKRQGAGEVPGREGARTLKREIARLEANARELSGALDAALLALPNVPRGDVPVGAGDADDVALRRESEPRRFRFEPRRARDLAERLGILDVRSGAGLAGSGFVTHVGMGAALERALANFMLDMHTFQHGYAEVSAPIVVCAECIVAAGASPQPGDAPSPAREGPRIAPSSEVPLVNLHRDEVLDVAALPMRYAALVTCLGRRGRDAPPEFHAVQLASFAEPERSEEEFARLVGNAEAILMHLGIPYEVVGLCTASLPPASAKTVVLRASCPGTDRQVEVSSCSLYDDYQARRCKTRYRPANGRKGLRFVHTLSGSALAIEPTLAAVLENYQREDGRVDVPKVLRPYLRGVAVIGE
jgi:seryl-tRNA synthetase